MVLSGVVPVASSQAKDVEYSLPHGRFVVLPSYFGQQPVLAGAALNLDGLWRTVITLGILFAAAVATLAVGFATGSLQSAVITGGVISLSAWIVHSYLSTRHSNF